MKISLSLVVGWLLFFVLPVSAQDTIPDRNHYAALQVGFSKLSIKDHGALVPLELVSQDFLTALEWGMIHPKYVHRVKFSFSGHHNFEYDLANLRKQDNEVFLYMLNYKFHYNFIRNLFGYIDVGAGPDLLLLVESNNIGFTGAGNYDISQKSGGLGLLLAMKMKLDDNLVFDLGFSNGFLRGREKVDAVSEELKTDYSGYYSELDVKLDFKLAQLVWFAAGAEIFEQLEKEKIYSRKLNRVTFSGTIKYVFK